MRLAPPHAPGDGPIEADSLILETPWRFGEAVAAQLVRRKVNVKEAFTVRDASGRWFRASLRELGPQGGWALPYEEMPGSPEPCVHITLACAVLARQRMIFVMQKATELGVMEIVPLFTAHSVPPEGLEHEKAHAWPNQVIRATKQCRRSSLPAISPPMPLTQFLDSPSWREADLRVYLDDRAPPCRLPLNRPARVVVVVGPEGGFSQEERNLLAAEAIPLVLGGRVLRAETAVVAGLVSVQWLWGDYGGRLGMVLQEG